MDIRYPAILTPEPDGGYLVQFPDCDEAFTEREKPEKWATEMGRAQLIFSLPAGLD
jgi:predicted RNase H-like HicB family nuclease